MILEITQDISPVISSCTAKLITLVVIASNLAKLFNFLGFYGYLPLVYPIYSTGLEQLLKYQLGVWVVPTTNFTSELPFLL